MLFANHRGAEEAARFGGGRSVYLHFWWRRLLLALRTH